MIHTFYSQNRGKFGSLQEACKAYCGQVKNSVTEFATRTRTNMTRVLNVLRSLYVVLCVAAVIIAYSLPLHSTDIKDEIERLESMERYSIVSINTLSDRVFHTLPSSCKRHALRYMATKHKREATVQVLKQACKALGHMRRCSPLRARVIDGLGEAGISITPDIAKATAAASATSTTDNDLFEALDFFVAEMQANEKAKVFPGTQVYARCIYRMAKPNSATTKALAAVLSVDRKKVVARQAEEDEITSAIRKAASARVPEEVVVDIARSVKTTTEGMKESRRSRARKTEIQVDEDDGVGTIVVLSTAHVAVRDTARAVLPEEATISLAFADFTGVSSGRTAQFEEDCAFAYETLCEGGVLAVHATTFAEMRHVATELRSAGFAVVDKPYVSQAAKSGKPQEPLLDRTLPASHIAFVLGIKPGVSAEGKHTTETAAHAAARLPTASYIAGGGSERYVAVPYPGYDVLEPYHASVKATASRLGAEKETAEDVKTLRDFAAKLLSTKRDIERVLLAIPPAVFGHLIDVFSEPRSIVLDMMSLPRPLVEPVHSRQRHYWRSSAYPVGLSSLNNAYAKLKPHVVLPRGLKAVGHVALHLALAGDVTLSGLTRSGKSVSAAPVSVSSMLPSHCPKLPVGRKDRFKGRTDSTRAHIVDAGPVGRDADCVLHEEGTEASGDEGEGGGKPDEAEPCEREEDEQAMEEDKAGGGESSEAAMPLYRRTGHPICLAQLNFLDDATLVEYLDTHMPDLKIGERPRSETTPRDEEFRMAVFLTLRDTNEYREDYTMCLPHESQDARWWEVHQLFSDSRYIGSRKDTLQSTRIKVIFDQFPWLGFTPNRYPPAGTYVSYVLAQLFHCARSAGVVTKKPGKIAGRIRKCDRNTKGAAWYWEPPTARQIAGFDEYDTSSPVEWK